MANPNNLIRPPVLNRGNAEEPPVAPARPLTLAELTPLISQIATQVLQQQVPSMVQNVLNPNANIGLVSDQIINEEHRNNMQDLDKVPDVVKYLREFSGASGEFNSWKKSVDRILQIYSPIRGTPKYYGILSIVRNKIVGDADIVLESYNTPLDWGAISKCLTLHYADKRDLSTLEYQMTSLVQGRSSIQDFYQLVYKHLSLILNKLGCLDASNESLYLLTKTYREKALDTFIRGLNGDLPKLLGIREPADLPQALHLCLKLENQTFRANYAHGSNYNTKKQNSQMQYHPPLPPRKFNPTPQAQFNYNNSRPAPQQRQMGFYPQLAYIPQVPYSQPNPNPNNYQQAPQYNSFPPRPQGPKPQPKPEPMEIDETLRTRRIDYMNRPRGSYATIRPPPSINQPQRKMQRTFHLDNEFDSYSDVMHQENSQHDVTLNDYLTSIQEPTTLNNQTLELSDIHFLE